MAALACKRGIGVDAVAEVFCSRRRASARCTRKLNARHPSSMTTRIVLVALCLTAVGLGVVAAWPEEVIMHPPGVLCPDDPEQEPPERKAPWLHGEYMVTPLASFSLRAVVLHVEWYHMGRESDLSPVDLALGWGVMSDQAVIDQLDISQSGRWYTWHADRLPAPVKEINRHSANMHIVPANETVRSALDDIVRGSLVMLRGSLVKITRDDGWRWISSLTREDTGNHACEVVWVEEVEVAKTP
jgi:hypothetical protein